jgi:hypothetical protein
MKYTHEEGKFAREAYEGRISVVQSKIRDLEHQEDLIANHILELDNELNHLILEHNKIVQNTEPDVKPEELEKSFVQLVELWQKQPDAYKDRFFDEVLINELFL